MRAEWLLRISLLLIMLLPWVVLLLMPDVNMWFWFMLMAVFILVWMAIGIPRRRMAGFSEPEPRMLYDYEQPEAIKQVMNVRIAIEKAGIQIFRGKLTERASIAFEKLKAALPANTVPLVQEDEELGTAILLLPRPVEEMTMERKVRKSVHWLLFLATLATTTFVGAAQQGINLLQDLEFFYVGLPYAMSLLAILGFHEFGHYFAAKKHKIRVTPPYFIPVPFALGTFGAFIQMRSPTENRKQLFDVAVAGPLAGLVIAIPALIWGLQSSYVVDHSGATLGQGTPVTSSILFALIAKIALGAELADTPFVRLSPMAFAGWLGLFITALNLMPVGQLDGGHMARAMFGNRTGQLIGTITMGLLFFVALFIWPALLIWALIVFFIAGRATPPLNDVSPLRKGRRVVGYITFLILFSILIPLPQAFWAYLGL
jgi:membrane-associated protease RseP (regulator of RpoE activity)